MKYKVEVIIKCLKEVEVDANDILEAEKEAMEWVTEDFMEDWYTMDANAYEIK